MAIVLGSQFAYAIRIGVAVTALVASVVCHASASPMRNGDLLVIDYGDRALVKVDRDTGDQEIFSKGAYEYIGEGPGFDEPTAIVMNARGEIFVADWGLPAIFKVDRETGDRKIIASPTIGNGTPDLWAQHLAIGPAGFLYGTTPRNIHRIDPATGDRTYVAGDGGATGYSIYYPFDITIAKDGYAYVSSFDGIQSVDLQTGAIDWIASGYDDQGPPDEIRLSWANTLAELSTGGLITTTQSHDGFYLIHVDPKDGSKIAIASNDQPGPSIDPSIFGLNEGPDGWVYGVHRGIHDVIKINPITGERLVHSTGYFVDPLDLTVVRGVPECSSMLFAITGLLGCLFCCRIGRTIS